MKLLFLLICVVLEMFAVDSIYTWGYGEPVYEMLMAIRQLVGGMGALERSAIAIGLFMIILRLFKGSSTFESFFSPLMMIVLVTGMMFGVTKDYMVEDEISGYTHAVNDVPLGVGEPMSLFSTLEKVTSRGIETSFSTPNSIHFTEAGLGFVMDVNLKALRLRPESSYLIRTFNEYTDNCIIPDIMIGSTSEETLLNSIDLLSDIRIVGWQTLAYSSTYPTGTDMPCEDAYDHFISPNIATLTLAQKSRLASSVGLDITKLDNGMEGASQLLYGVTKTSEEQIQQAIVQNLFNEGLNYYAEINGMDATATATGKALMDRTIKSQWLMSGLAGREFLPILKSTLVILIGALTPLLVLLAVATLNLAYIKTILYIYLTSAMIWPVLAILNHMMYVFIERSVSPNLTADGGFTLVNSIQFNDDLSSYISWLNFMGILSPLIAYSIVKGSEQGFVSMFNALSGATGGGVSAASNQMGTGNFSHGNASSGNININDQVGMHTAVGDAMRTNKIGYAGSQIEEHRVGGSNYEKINTQTGSGITLDSSGEAVNYDNRAVQLASSSSVNNSLGQAHSKMESVTDQFADSLSSGYGMQFMSAKSVNEMDNVTSSMGLSGSTGHSLSTAAQQAKLESIREGMTSDDVMKFSREASSHAGIDFKTDQQVFGWIAEKASGLSLNAGGKISVSGSDGSSFSFQTSGESTKNIQESFSDNLSKQLNENQGLTHDIARQIVDQKAFSDTRTYNTAQNYSKSFAEMEQLQHTKNVLESSGLNVNKDLALPLLRQIVDDSPELSAMVKTHPERAYIEADRTINKAARGDNPVAAQAFNEALIKVTGGIDFQKMEDRVAAGTQAIPEGLGVHGAIVGGKEHIEDLGRSIVGSGGSLPRSNDNEYKNGAIAFRQGENASLGEFNAQHNPNYRREILSGHETELNKYLNAKNDGVIGVGNEIDYLGSAMPAYGADGNIKNSVTGEKLGEWSRKDATQDPVINNINQDQKSKEMLQGIDDLKRHLEDKNFAKGTRGEGILNKNGEKY